MDPDAILLERAKRGKGNLKYQGAIEYHGELIAQWHNPKLFIDDIIGENETKQFTSIMLIGTPGTGKTTLATFISHNIHIRKPNYYVQHFNKKELLKFDQIINNLPSGRDVILIFDDVSLVFKEIRDPGVKTRILQTLTEARHPKFETSDRKVIVISNVHYMNALEKMWRSQGSWKFYTDMSGEEADVFNHMTKSKFKQKVQIFAQTTLEQFRRKQFDASLTKNKKHTYKINEPFRFVMCYDNSHLRFFLVPEEYCNLCSEHGQKLSKIEATPEEIDKLICRYYGVKDGRAGMKLALTNAGVTHQFRNNVVYSFNLAYDVLSVFSVDPDKLADYYRKIAQIPDKRLYTINKKKKDFIADLKEIRAKNKSAIGNFELQAPEFDDIDINL